MVGGGSSLILTAPQNVNYCCCSRSPEIMRKAYFHVLDLASISLAGQLQIQFRYLSSPSRTHWMPLRLQPSARVYRYGPVEGGCSALDKLASLAWSAEAQVLVGDDFSNCEAVMDLCHIDVLRFDIRHLVSLLGSHLRSLHCSEAFPLMKTESVLRLASAYDVNVVVRDLL